MLKDTEFGQDDSGVPEGVSWFKEHGFRIYGVVVDGLCGLAEALRTFRSSTASFTR